MSDPRNRQYTNGEITVFWVPSKCIHATTCFRELIEVFNPGRRPWVNMDGAHTRRIIEVVNKCPTQSLEWKYNKDMSEEELAGQWQDTASEVTPRTLETNNIEDKEAVKIKIMKDGPIVVEGKFRVVDSNEEQLKTSTMTSFCRCGYSMNMPWCDGTHRKKGFTDETS